MKDGYYWARERDAEQWVIVEVFNYGVSQMGEEGYFYSSGYEFGDRIEIPEKYK